MPSFFTQYLNRWQQKVRHSLNVFISRLVFVWVHVYFALKFSLHLQYFYDNICKTLTIYSHTFLFHTIPRLPFASKVKTQIPAVLAVNILVVMTAVQYPGGRETKSQSATKCTTTQAYKKTSELITCVQILQTWLKIHLIPISQNKIHSTKTR